MTRSVYDPWSWVRRGAVAVMLGLVIGCGRGRTLPFSLSALVSRQAPWDRLAAGDRLSDSKGGQSRRAVDADTQHVAEGPLADRLPSEVAPERHAQGSAAAAADHGTESLAPGAQAESAQAAYMKELLQALQVARAERDAAEKVVETERRSSAGARRKIQEEAESRREILAKEIAARGADIEVKAAALSAAKLDAAKSQTEAKELKSEVDALRAAVAARNEEMAAAKNAAEEREAKAAGELSEARAEVSSLRAALQAEQKKEGETAAVLKSDAAKEKSDLLDQLASVRQELQAAQRESSDRAGVARESSPAPAERAESPFSSGGPSERGAELGNVSRELSAALATRERLLREIQKAGNRAQSSGKDVVVYPNAAEGETARLSKTLADTEGLITQLTARLAALQQ